jgi:hypothetical protein
MFGQKKKSPEQLELDASITTYPTFLFPTISNELHEI